VAPLRKKTASRPELTSLEDRLDREEAELLDVPAAVVCARCGDAECAGCLGRDERSGIVSVVAWERAGVPVLSRLWSTARAGAMDEGPFFEGLPDGPLWPAIRFAVACELLASGAMFLAALPVVVFAAPAWAKSVLVDEASRTVALRLVVVGLPAFAGLLVLAHAAHGLSIDLGARRKGARGEVTRALRFGLYACGWDLVVGPLGAVVLAAKEGAGAALSVASLGAGLPTRATTAFLRGCYRLDGEEARSALATSYVGAALTTVAGALLVIAFVLGFLLL
jgi:hypothetical protein